MLPETVGLLILVAGGLLLAGASVMLVRGATRWPSLVARVAQLEIAVEGAARNASEAVDIALKARRTAASRATRRARNAPEELEPVAPTLVQDAPPAWQPGATLGGRIAQPDAATGTDGPTPIGFADES